MKSRISRRRLLRGLGAGVALPLLESMVPSTPLRAAAPAGPKRMAFLFVPNGVNVANWFPKRTGYDFDFPPILEPLAPFKHDLLVLSGLTHDKGRANGDGPGDHARSASVFLTGAQPRKTSGSGIRSGISVDQVAARQAGGQTMLPSLELGCEPGRSSGNCDSGYSCAYSSSISWSDPSTPLGKEVNPRNVFERLFGQSDKPREVRERQHLQQTLRKSILDFVSEDARRLRRSVSRNDQRKLDQYLDGVRAIEQRMERADQESIRRAPMARPGGIPPEYAKHVQLMCDLMVVAFQTDLTRISTFMLANAGSNRSYRMIGVPDGHHSLSHHGNNEQKLAKIAKINRFHVEQFAYLIGRLRSIREGDGTLLDQCMIVYGSGLNDGNRHNNENLPMVMAGRGGGTIRTGRHLAVPVETPVTNLFLAMLERFGTPVPWLGDSTGILAGLS